MLITIDGHAASGKSTQSHALAKAIDGQRTNHYIFKVRELRNEIASDSSLKSKNDLYFLFDIIQLKFAASSANFWYNVTAPIVSDEYWLILWERGIQQKYLDLMKALVPIPDISFYINISASDSYKRGVFRQQCQDKAGSLSDIVVPDKYAERFLQRDVSDKTFWKWLGSEVSNVHILDGNQSEPALTNEMLRIMKDDYGIKINSDL